MSSEIDTEVFNDLKNALDVLIDKRSKRKSSTHIAEVSSLGDDGVIWVQIPGNPTSTPVVWSGVDTKVGDQVRVEISNGVAKLTENLTDPSAGIQIVVEGQERFNADLQRVEKTVVADRVETVKLLAQKASIDELEAVEADIETLNVAKEYVGELVAAEVTAEDLAADKAYIDTLNAWNITADKIVADSAEIDNLNINYAHLTNGQIDNVAVDYAQIDLANVTEAMVTDEWVNRLMVQTRLIAQDGNIYKLNALEVDAANITAGTLDVQRLVFTDPDSGEKYFVTWDDNAQELVRTYLDGQTIAPNSIAADRIVANSITADQLTTNNIEGTNGWINLAAGEFEYLNDDHTEGIAWKEDENGNMRLTIVGEALDIFAKSSDVATLSGELDDVAGQMADLGAHVRIESRTVGQTEVPVIVLDAAGGNANIGMSAELSNTALQFKENGEMVAEISNNELVVTQASIGTASVSGDFSVGNFAWIPMADSSLAFKWIEPAASS